MNDGDMHKSAKFWGLVVLIWVCLVLGIENIIQKVNLLVRMSGG